MASTKRRKLVAPEQPQALSAFARLRQSQRLDQGSEKSQGPNFINEGEDEQSISIRAKDEEVEKALTRKKPKNATRSSHSVTDQEELFAPNDEAPVIQNIASNSNSIARSQSISSLEGNQMRTVEAPIIQFSSFKPTKSNFQKKAGGKLRLALSEGDVRLVILGSYGIFVVNGEITVQGAVLRATKDICWIHAPHCHALPVLRCPEEAVIELEPHPAADSIRNLGALSPLFQKLWNDIPLPNLKGKRKANSTFEILFTSADGPRKTMLADLKSLPEWRREIERLAESSRSRPIVAMVTGPKSSGKSTFGKLLSNHLLSHVTGKRQVCNVAVIDLDPGQPEHGIPGQVSLVRVTKPLFGPSFCRPLQGSQSESDTTIIRSHALAAISPASDPKLYIAAAADLLNHYHNRLGSLSLIINTPGWIQGTGLDLLISLISLFRPSHLVYMATGPVDVIESLQESFKSGALIQLPSQTTQYTTRTAAHLRSMQTMSYFHTYNPVTSKSKTPLKWNPSPLSTVAPWQLSFADPTPGILGIMCYDYQAPSDLLAEAINGTILAVVEVESPSAFGVPAAARDAPYQEDTMMDFGDTTNTSSFDYVKRELITKTPEGIPFINSGGALDPRYSQSIGHILLRGIDIENGVLQVLTPIPEDRIQQINEKGEHIVLVSGKFDPPSWAYTEDLYRQASLGHNDGESDEEGQVDVLEESIVTLSGQESDIPDTIQFAASVPWIEALHGNQRRGIGSRVWRVRRDLGRAGNAGD